MEHYRAGLRWAEKALQDQPQLPTLTMAEKDDPLWVRLEAVEGVKEAQRPLVAQLLKGHELAARDERVGRNKHKGVAQLRGRLEGVDDCLQPELLTVAVPAPHFDHALRSIGNECSC